MFTVITSIPVKLLATNNACPFLYSIYISAWTSSAQTWIWCVRCNYNPSCLLGHS